METLGYRYLVEEYRLDVLSLPVWCVLGEGRVVEEVSMGEGVERRFPMRYRTDGTWQGHLLFAIKHEGVNMEVLRALFPLLDAGELSALVASSPHGVYLRRLWFLYEFLMGRELSVPALKTGNYDRVLSPEECLCLDDDHSWKARRQRLLCNLPGDAQFCPVVRLTSRIRESLAKDLGARVRKAVGGYSEGLVDRANDYLYLKETKSSYAIERQTPSQKRAAVFMDVLREAGREALNKSLLLRVHNAIVDERYAESDYRSDQVYVGQTLAPGHELAHFVGMKPGDLSSFMEAYLETAERLLDSNCDAVIVAAVLSFAFVFVHPFDDGNGRLHRYLMHHVLNAMEFCPKNVVFPVSALLHKDEAFYNSMLEDFSRRLMTHVEYRLAADGTMTVENETVDFYRYIDFTRIVEEFFVAVERTLENELVPELEELSRWERARILMGKIVDMPDRRLALFVLFVRQNQGTLPKSRREFFAELSDEEIAALERVVQKTLMPDRLGKG